ncbi:PP2C family protein-serine/threonine phosphatase [Streptomyces sp. NPDC058249]|uniref:PP2C family protein-serine/threonine phosphatase n=1 Tax=Streptomyces sp. NPDC058249 TaxID=3346403 RepID=UPI0036F18254
MEGGAELERRDSERRAWLRGAPPAPWVRVLPLALLAGICVAELSSRETLDLGFLLSAIAPLAVLSYGPTVTALLGSIAVVLLNVHVLTLGNPGNQDSLTVGFVAVMSAFISWVRSHRDAQLVTVRTVAEAAQLAVLPPLPGRVGQVNCAGLYWAAQRGTLVGGDFFEVRRGPYGVRALVGDVQGHGMSAVGTVTALLGAFREAVLDQPDLNAVAARLERRLVIDSADVKYVELFATVVLLEFPDDARVVRVLSCGHPPPVLLRGDKAVEVEVAAGAPLGLGFDAVAPPETMTLALEPGDRLVAVSDGVTEAREKAGGFYPLAERLATLGVNAPARITERLWDDLVRHCGAPKDDVAVLVLAPEPGPGPSGTRYAVGRDTRLRLR